VTVDTGWLIAAERDPRRARLHIAALTRLGQVMVVSPVVIVEARQRAGDAGRVDVVLARLEQEGITPEDGRRASDLLRDAGRQSGDPDRRVHEFGLADALVTALAERLGGIVYTCDPEHLGWLRDAGAQITVAPVPF
jgi:predicted nucleic acid-binding protein